MRVRRTGKSFAHPLVVLIIQDVQSPLTRFAITAGTTLGNAVKRNRAKRLLRAGLGKLIKKTKPGYNCILIARKALLESNSKEAEKELELLFRQAGIYIEE
jgi:ribonuclease P protein component